MQNLKKRKKEEEELELIVQVWFTWDGGCRLRNCEEIIEMNFATK